MAGAAMRGLASGTAEPVLAESYLAPGVPLRLQRDGQLLIYRGLGWARCLPHWH
ncbi:MAG: hypothetical protein K0R43_93 [Pseudoduganella sp.]|jgi:hypothetical protein|nr:hypothetical protein [Pseudoduganella sp.]